MLTNNYGAIRPVEDHRELHDTPWDAFTWEEGILTTRRWHDHLTRRLGSLYVVTFYSEYHPEASEEQIEEVRDHDHRAWQEANQSGGLLMYKPGALSVEKIALSTCVWKSPADAKKALDLPAHKEAVRSIMESEQEFGVPTYLNYDVNRYSIRRRDPESTIEWAHHQQDGSLVAVGITTQEFTD